MNQREIEQIQEVARRIGEGRRVDLEGMQEVSRRIHDALPTAEEAARGLQEFGRALARLEQRDAQQR